MFEYWDQVKRDPDRFTSKWAFVEFLITAPEKPVQGIVEGKPVYFENISKHEEFRIAAYK